MTLAIKTIRPGYLVVLKTAIRGNVSYDRQIIEGTAVDKDGVETEAWETKRRVANAKEHKRAKVARSKANSLIRSVCVQTSFGLLCPDVDSDKLEAAVKAAHAVVDEFNSTSELTKVFVGAITGKVTPDDAEAVRMIKEEVRGLMDEVSRGVGNNDVKSIRKAASGLKEVGEALPVDARATVTMAVETARTTATAIKKAGDGASVDKSAIKRITELRAAFVDLDETKPVAKAKKAKAKQLELGA
jgi:hypothetical protein